MKILQIALFGGFLTFGIISTEIFRNENFKFYKGMKCLKLNLNFISKLEGKYNTATHSAHRSMTLTISIIFRLP